MISLEAFVAFWPILGEALKHTFDFQSATSFFGYIQSVLDYFGDVAIAFWEIFP